MATEEESQKLSSLLKSVGGTGNPTLEPRAHQGL